jgi:hypothetical protein
MATLKFLVKTGVDIAYTKEVTKEVTKLYKDLGLEVKFDVEDVVLDLKNELLYSTENSWSFLSLRKTKTINWSVVFAFHKPGYDGTCLFVLAKDGLQDMKTRGQYQRTGDIGLIEVYSAPKKFIKKKLVKGENYYETVTKKSDLKHDTFVLFHEVAHHLEQCVGMDGLHKAELKDVQGIYLETVITLLKKNSKITKLFPRVERDIKTFLKLAKEKGIPCRVTEGFRSIERQNELYAQGRTTKGNIVTNAKGGESFHNYGVAFDIVPLAGYNIKSSQWAILGEIGTSLGYDWGGYWKGGFVDKPHYELTFNYTLKDFQKGDVDYSKYL